MTSADHVSTAYDRWAATYDIDENRTRDLDAEVVHGWAPVLRDRDVFEFGCGTGKNTATVAAVARTLTSVDVSPGMLDRARRRPGVAAVRFVRLEPDDDWPVDAGSVDVVMANLVLEHLASLAPFMDRAARAVRDDGVVLVSELHPDRQRRGSMARGAGGASGTHAPPCHLHTMAEYVTAATAAGLTIDGLQEPLEDDAAPEALPRLVVWRLRRR